MAEFLAKLHVFGGFRSTKLQFYPLRPTCIIFSEPHHLVPDNEQIGIASSKSMWPFLPRPEAYVEMDGRLLSLDQWMDPEFGWVTSSSLVHLPWKDMSNRRSRGWVAERSHSNKGIFNGSCLVLAGTS